MGGLFKNTAIMTGTSVLLRLVGMLFQVYISRKMGAAGVGLYYLVMSVNMFAATVAISGARFATTRLVSEELGRGRTGSIRKAVRICLGYAVLFGVAAGVMVYFSAEFVGERLIKDARTVFSLRLLALSLPFLSAGAVLGGYFTGVMRVSGSAVGAVSEQVFRTVISAFLLSLMPAGDTEKMCASVVIGGVMGEILSFFVIFFIYLKDRKRYPKTDTADGMGRRMVAIAAPLAASAYARTLLSMAQNLLVPQGLRRSGRSAEHALADYGTIQGMVFPIITFPSVLFASVSELMVPELTKEQMQGRFERITGRANGILRLCLIFSLGVMGVLLALSDELGMAVYSNADVGKYIRLLAFLMPFMYMDSVTDGMLRGIGEQMYCMRINVADSLICTVLIYILLPKFAVYGYIFILYASEIVNYYFSMKRLKERANVSVRREIIFSGTLSSLAASALVRLALRRASLTGVCGIAVGVSIYAAAYLAALHLLGILKIGKREVRISLKNM